MSTWPVQDAKARFSEFLDACLAEGPQLVTRRGAEAAVLVPVDEWRRLQAAARPSLKQLLLADEARAELVLPRARQGASAHASGVALRRHVPAGHQRRLRAAQAAAAWRRAGLAAGRWTTRTCSCRP